MARRHKRVTLPHRYMFNPIFLSSGIAKGTNDFVLMYHLSSMGIRLQSPVAGGCFSSNTDCIVMANARG